MSARTRLSIVALVLALTLPLQRANAGLYLPDAITALVEGGACGIRADCSLSGSTLRVELVTAPKTQSLNVAARVYQPNSSAP